MHTILQLLAILSISIGIIWFLNRYKITYYSGHTKSQSFRIVHGQSCKQRIDAVRRLMSKPTK